MEEKFSIVAIVDALGVSHKTIEESRDFSKRKEELIRWMNEKEYSNLCLRELQEAESRCHSLKMESAPEIRSFGDTVIIFWTLESKPNFLQWAYAGYWLRSFFYLGLIQGLLFRGAVSAGLSLIGKDEILGPSVYDAAAWHQDADWFGISMTPAAHLSCLGMFENTAFEEKGSLLQMFVPYMVPRKAGNSVPTFALCWPADFLTLSTASATDFNVEVSKINLAVLLDSAIGEKSLWPIPIGTEKKYENSLAFMKHVSDHVLPNYRTTSLSGRLRTVHELMNGVDGGEGGCVS